MTDQATPSLKVVRALQTSSAVQATSKDPRTKIEAATWQLFFSLPLSTLFGARDSALEAHRDTTAQELEPVGAQNAGGAQ